MWKARPEEDNRLTLSSSQSASPATTTPAGATTSSMNLSPKETPKHVPEPRADVGHIGKSVVLRGELTGNEDLYLDGEIDGNINLRDHKLVIGPNAKIKATISARDVVVHGKVEGNINSTERVELKRSCSLTGDVCTQRIVIEDGAFFKGAIDIKEHKDHHEHKAEQRKSMAVASGMGGNSSSVSSTPSLSASSGSQGSFLEPK